MEKQGRSTLQAMSEEAQREGKTHRCVRCRDWFARTDFTQQITRNLCRLICDECKNKKNTRRCFQCEQHKPETAFSATKWGRVLATRICLECSEGRRCSSCDTRGGADKFPAKEWDKADGIRKCKECVPKRCPRCRKAKVKSAYSTAQWRLIEGKAVCVDCDRKRCGKCNKEKGFKEFTPHMWELADGGAAVHCKKCTHGERTKGMWTCVNKNCQMKKPKAEFGKAIAKYGESVAGTSRRCDDCVSKFEAELEAQSQKTLERVQKKPRKQ